MILHELVGGTEHNPVYQELAASNGLRVFAFIRSAVTAALGVQRDYLSTEVIKALNFHAITCLHVNAGEYRPCLVTVGDPPNVYHPPAPFLVHAFMDDFVNLVNRRWETTDAIALVAFVLWRLNNIHPFINGNGRTARATAYLVLCLKAGRVLPGRTILPELIEQNRPEYLAALKAADQGTFDHLHNLLGRLVGEQLASAAPPPGPPPRKLNRRIVQSRRMTKRDR